MLSASVAPSVSVNAVQATSLDPGHSPAEIRHAYGFDQIRFRNGKVAGDGSGQTIAIVNPFDDPTISADLHQFDVQFKLPDPPEFLKVDELGGQDLPAANARWASETALDVEWAHAIAPKANLALVESDSAGLGDVIQAVDTARHLPGVSVVSMSWGTQEFESERLLDALFTTPAAHGGVTFVAAAGDVASADGTQWPAISANVLSVGGTSLSVQSGSGAYISESVWAGSTAGTSAYEPSSGAPDAAPRTVPDVSYDADPTSGYAVFNSTVYQGRSGWQVVGGTSAGAPQWAALVAVADQGRQLNGLAPLDGSTGTLPLLYQIASLGFNSIGDAAGPVAPSLGDTFAGLGSPRADQVAQALSEASPIPPPAPQLSDFTAAIVDSSTKDGGIKGKPAVTPAGQPYVATAAAFAPLRIDPPASVRYLRSIMPAAGGAAAVAGVASPTAPVNPQPVRWSTTLISAAPAYAAAREAIGWARNIQPPHWLVPVGDGLRDWISGSLRSVGDSSPASDQVLAPLTPDVVYHFATINIERTFSDTLGAFIRECASAPSAATAPPNLHRRAWAITLLALGADAVVLRFALARRDRKKKLAVVASRLPLRPRRTIRARTVQAGMS